MLVTPQLMHLAESVPLTAKDRGEDQYGKTFPQLINLNGVQLQHPFWRQKCQIEYLSLLKID